MTAKTVLGTCHHDCPDTCGWVATVDDNGVASKLRGNPEHPYSKGELCPKVNRFLDRVYSPDRLTTPLIRTGPKGAAEFRPATWDEALALIAERTNASIAEHGGETIFPWRDAGTQGLLQMTSLDRRFFGALGASRMTGSVCGAVAGIGTASTLGTAMASDPSDIRHSKLAILWGTNTRLTNRHLWPAVEEARVNGAVVVVVDPMRTITAESADWFIQPLPGTDVALMLAMLHVIVHDGLVDEAYVADHTTGFDELRDHVAAWTPARAAAVCGLEVDEIERFATAYGTAEPAFIRTLIGAEHHENGAMFFRTLAMLPTVTGSWRHLGGGLARSVGAYNEANVDESVFDLPADQRAATRGFNQSHLGRMLTDDTLDPPITTLFVWAGNPVVTIPNAALIREGMSRDDLFTVVSEQFMTDTAAYADVVLPATTQLEHLDVVPSWGHVYLGWNEPAIAPVGDSISSTDLWRRLAAVMEIDDPLFDLDDRALIELALHDVDVDELRRVGFVRQSVPVEILPYRDGGFGTPSGKVEFASESLDARGHGRLPDYVPIEESPTSGSELASRFPLALLTPKHHTRFLNSSYSHLPRHGGLEGGPFVELDAADAEARGLAEGDTARVFNDRSELFLPVRVGKRLRPGLCVVPFGWSGGDHGNGQTANSLTNDKLTDWGGGVAYSDTLVEVEAVPTLNGVLGVRAGCYGRASR